MDFQVDLRDALPNGMCIGAAIHDPEKSAYLRQNGVPRHYNVGVLYVRNTALSLRFFTDWLAAHPGPERWMDQGAFNELIVKSEYLGLVGQVGDTWNATIDVNMVDNPAVLGWHGIMPPERRLAMMRNTLFDDHLKFRV
jgi:hypothetical protein